MSLFSLFSATDWGFGKKLGLALFILSMTLAPLFMWACQTNDADADYFLDLQGADSLKNYDKVIIVVRDSLGNLLDTAFQGKVTSVNDLSKLPLSHFQNGIMNIEVNGYQGQTLVLQQVFSYNSVTKIPSDNVFVRTPQTSISLPDTAFTVTVGENRLYPKPKLLPANLKDTSLLWSVSDTTKVQLQAHSYTALLPGDVNLTVRLASDTAKKAQVTLHVTASTLNNTDSIALKSLILKPDTVKVLVGLASKPFFVLLDPANAHPTLRYESFDSTVASVTVEGEITGMKAGKTQIRVYTVGTQGQTNLADTSVVMVAEPVAVDSVRFDRDSLWLYAGGASATLTVRVYPDSAAPGLTYRVVDTTLATLVGNQLQGLAPGKTLVIAASKATPNRRDTMVVVVKPKVIVDAVNILADSITLYLGGPANCRLASRSKHLGHFQGRQLICASRGTHNLACDQRRRFEPKRQCHLDCQT
jgi:hypothetical protein